MFIAVKCSYIGSLPKVPPIRRVQGGLKNVCQMKIQNPRIYYNPKLTPLARKLRNESTKAEIHLWQELKRDRLKRYDFHRQKPIDNYILDFFCYELMLAIEVDGLTHQWEEVFEKDQKKENRMNELGISVLRFDDNEVLNDMDNVLRVIEGFMEDFEEQKDTSLTPSLKEGRTGLQVPKGVIRK